MPSLSNCVFCRIGAGEEPARIRYVDEEIIAIVNKLTWVPLMLLVMPKSHLTQLEVWSGGVMNRMGKVATDLGVNLSPKKYSNEILHFQHCD